ncbi:hypothetical protein [Gramella sp. AN32]|uniref:Uncharacterized protein n=1 Tax=Christiangramia antarctica TaxID=2058158 RepID=A0ABW5X2B3_9FLAO|nr:hypothetical protein [Gramella sp. AN32]MCM4156306.1 hypothetical protein [Gramella sp. AN32]
MKSNFKILILILCFGIFLSGYDCRAQESDKERIIPPKKLSKVKSIDEFSAYTFDIYNNLYVYDSLVEAEIEIPAELEDALAENIETRVDSLLNVVPDMLDDIDSAPIMRKLRAAGSLNKSRKAITYMLEFTKKYTLGEPQEAEPEIVKN